METWLLTDVAREKRLLHVATQERLPLIVRLIVETNSSKQYCDHGHSTLIFNILTHIGGLSPGS